MGRRIALLAAVFVVTATSTDRCSEYLPHYWNRFAVTATAYVNRLQGGVKDVRLRQKMLDAWRDLDSCGCF